MKSVAICLLLFFCACTTGTKKIIERKYEPLGTKQFEVENADIKVSYESDTSAYATPIKIHNKSDQPITLHWNEFSLSIDGSSERVFHEGIKIIDRNAPMPDGIIPPKQMIVESLIPTNRIFWSSGWEYLPICGKRGEPYGNLVAGYDSLQYNVDDEMCLGKTFSYFISYSIKQKKKYLELKFKYIDRQDKTPANNKK